MESTPLTQPANGEAKKEGTTMAMYTSPAPSAVRLY